MEAPQEQGMLRAREKAHQLAVEWWHSQDNGRTHGICDNCGEQIGRSQGYLCNPAFMTSSLDVRQLTPDLICDKCFDLNREPWNSEALADKLSRFKGMSDSVPTSNPDSTCPATIRNGNPKTGSGLVVADAIAANLYKQAVMNTVLCGSVNPQEVTLLAEAIGKAANEAELAKVTVGQLLKPYKGNLRHVRLDKVGVEALMWLIQRALVADVRSPALLAKEATVAEYLADRVVAVSMNEKIGEVTLNKSTLSCISRGEGVVAKAIVNRLLRESAGNCDKLKDKLEAAFGDALVADYVATKNRMIGGRGSSAFAFGFCEYLAQKGELVTPPAPPPTTEWQALHQEVLDLYHAGRYGHAVVLAQNALRVAEQNGSPDHLNVAGSLNILALLHDVQGDYAKAEPLLMRSLAIWEEAWGSNNLMLPLCLNNLALHYDIQGDYAKSESLYQRSLAIIMGKLHADHPNVSLSLSNLAEFYRAQGDYAKSEPLFQRLLATREKALATRERALDGLPESLGKLSELYSLRSDMATSLNDLGEVYRTRGDFARAKPLLKRSLKIREKVLGPDHPDVGQSLNNLAELYRAQGNYAKAQPLHQRALAIWEKALGPGHPAVAQSLGHLAALHRARGNYAKAEPLHDRAMAIRERVFGLDQLAVQVNPNNLARHYEHHSDFAKAELVYKRLIAIREGSLGADHPDVAESLNYLAMLYRIRGPQSLAEPLYQRSIAIWEMAYGPDHPAVTPSLSSLADVYRAQGNFAKAEPLYQRALAVREKALGPDHPDVASSLNNLSELYRTQGDNAKAKPLLRRSLAITKNVRGASTPPLWLRAWRILFGRKKGEPSASMAANSSQTTAGRVTDSRLWKCPRCDELLDKRALGTVWMPFDPITKVAGTGTCSKCGAEFAQSDIYGGRFDIETPASSAKSHKQPRSISLVVFCIRSYQPPTDAKSYCRKVLAEKFPSADIKGHYVVGFADDLSAGDASAMYQDCVRKGQLPDLGRQVDSLKGLGPDGESIVALFFEA